MMPVKSWFKWLLSEERRHGQRQEALPLVAYYWDGAAPTARAVRDISPEGMYLLTDQRWYPNTLIKVTLTRSDKPDTDLARSILLTGRVVRSDADGVGLAFLPPGSRQSRDPSNNLPEEADRKTLIKFLANLRGDADRSVAKFLAFVPVDGPPDGQRVQVLTLFV